MALPLSVNHVDVTNLLSGRRFLVEWSLNADNVTAYKVYRSPNQDQGYQLVATIADPGTQFVDKVPFTYGAVFYYKVVAVNSSGMSGDLTQASAVTDITFDEFEEKPFRSTDISIDSFVFAETPGGALDGVNLNFTTAKYFRAGTLRVYVDGTRLSSASIPSYIEGMDQKSFTLTTPLLASNNDYIIVDYIAL